MKVDLNSALNVSEVSVDFSKATRAAKKDGFVAILKHGKLKYILLDTDQVNKIKEIAQELVTN